MTKAGRVAMVPADAYVHGKQYTKLDVVTYEKCTYIAKRDNKNVYPTKGASNDDWMITIDESDIAERVDWLDKRAAVGQAGSSGLSKPWYKFASLENTGLTQFTISFKVRSILSYYVDLGILTAAIRRIGNNIVANSPMLIWEYANSEINLNDFMMLYKLEDGMTKVELWCKTDQADRRFVFEVLDESNYVDNLNVKWTLYNQVSAGYAEEPTPGYTQIPSTLMKLANPIAGSVGVRNYLRSPDNPQVSEHETQSTAKRTYDRNTGEYKLTYEWTISALSDRQVCYYKVISDLDYIKGKRVTFSVDYAEYSNPETDPCILFRFTTGETGTDDIANSSNITPRMDIVNGKGLKRTINVPDSNTIKGCYLILRMAQNNSKNLHDGDTLTVRGLTLTVGETAVDWTPNPEDYMDRGQGINLLSNDPSNWEQGLLNEGASKGDAMNQMILTTGQYYSTRIRTKTLIPVNSPFTVSSYIARFNLLLFDKSEKYLGIEDGWIYWRDDRRCLCVQNKDVGYVAVTVGKEDNGPISPSDIRNAKVKIENGVTDNPIWSPCPDDFSPVAFSGKYEDLDLYGFMKSLGTPAKEISVINSGTYIENQQIKGLNKNIVYYAVAESGTEVAEAYYSKRFTIGRIKTKNSEHMSFAVSNGDLSINTSVDADIKVYQLTVPVAELDDQNKFLSGAGTWVDAPGGPPLNTTVLNFDSANMNPKYMSFGKDGLYLAKIIGMTPDYELIYGEVYFRVKGTSLSDFVFVTTYGGKNGDDLVVYEDREGAPNTTTAFFKFAVRGKGVCTISKLMD